MNKTKQDTNQKKPCESCEKNNKPNCGNEWCFTNRKEKK